MGVVNILTCVGVALWAWFKGLAWVGVAMWAWFKVFCRVCVAVWTWFKNFTLWAWPCGRG